MEKDKMPEKIKIEQIEKQYIFPMSLAIQCIPEFHRSVDELEPFLEQIKYFADQIPDGDRQKPLLNIVLMKLKGKAASFINRIKSETLAEMLSKLRSTFSKNISAEEILQNIETLEQGFKESFTNYADRALRIQESLEALQEELLQQQQQQLPHITSFAERSLRIHFIGGLRNVNLKQVAKAQKVSSFNELIQILESEHKECEQLVHIEQRLQACKLSKNQQFNQNQYSGQRSFNNYDRNLNFNNSFSENRIRNFNNSNNQRNFNNNRNFYDNRRPSNIGGNRNDIHFNPPQDAHYNHQQRGYIQNQNIGYQTQNSSNWNNRHVNNYNTRSLNNNLNQQQNQNHLNRREFQSPRNYQSYNNNFQQKN